MKFTGFTLSLALTSMVSAAAIPALPGADVVGGVEGAAQDIVADVAGGHMRRQVEAVQPVTNGFASSLNGGVGIVGSAVGIAESTISGAGHVKRQLEAVRPVTEGAASSLNGGTGIVGSAVGTAESTSQGAVYTVENSVGSVGNIAKRQLGNLPATAQQTSTDVIAGLSGNPSGIYGALANLKMIVDAGQLSPSDISNLPAAVQRVIANLAVA